MGRHNELGKEGEEKAVAFLQEKGYVILEKNYRSGRAEVDIIAGFKDIIVFVEVKTRSSYVFGYPEESVTSAKQKLMVRAAGNYLYEKNLEKEVRFDIIAIFRSKDEKWFFKHFEDAFFLYG
ncbi:MAG: YraN family protein [Bacteroidetes bacterium]|jgi:putative endonuclease|nr:YraN family protein [Bacteroidota bacterium]MBK7568024.1 YraN family protein [Bacteroidota bacterium]MBP9796668.1 YraN family protein [Chitinophagales bacterium]